MEFVGRSEELAQLAREHGQTPRVLIIEGTPGVGKSAFAMEAASILADQLVVPGRRWTFGWETQSRMQCPSDETADGRAKQLWRRGRARGKLTSKCNKGTCRAPTGHREPRILRRVKPEP